jgi:predicted RNase H-like HicB family nuclease
MKFGLGLINLYIVETHCINSDKMRNKMRNFTAIIYKEEDMYVAECSEVGTVSQGKTIEEAINNLKEATELYLEEFPFKEERKPLLTTFEVAVSAKA